MDLTTIIRVNLPMVILNALANLFFIFCLVRPFQGEALKQPLKLLLWTMICSTLSFLGSPTLLFHFTDRTTIRLSTYGIFVFSLSTSMSTSVWLNFFYCMQIVPSKTAIFIWVKKNLKPIMYCIWVVEKLHIGVFVTSLVWYNISVLKYELENVNVINSSDVVFIETPSYSVSLSLLIIVFTKVYFIICLCIMAASSWSTVTYLSRHMCQMAIQGLSCSRFHSQVRVTVTGILQVALFVFASVWTLSQHRFTGNIGRSEQYTTLPNITIINVYMVGTSVNLGVGQAVFRQRAVDLWHRAVRCCSTRKPQRKEPKNFPLASWKTSA